MENLLEQNVADIALKLAELEADLHQHIHLENNLLFTKATQKYQGQ